MFTALFPFHTWVPDGHSSAPTAGSMFLAGISMKLGGYGCLRVATYLMPEEQKNIHHHYCTCNHCNFIRRLRYHDAEGSEIYQCLFIRQSLRVYFARYRYANKNSYNRCCNANGISWIDDSSFLRRHRDDLRSHTYKAW